MFKRSVLKLKTKAKMRHIGRYTPSDWSKSQNEAQETGWAGLSFSFLFANLFIKQNLEAKSKK